MGFEISKAHTFPVSSLSIYLMLMDQSVSFQLMLQHNAWLAVAMFPIMIVMDLPFETVSPQ